MRIEIKKLNKLPKDLLDLLKKEFEDEELSLNDIDDIIQYIRDYGDYKKSTDSDYINYDYFCDLGKWRLYAFGSCYIKDQSICDEEISDYLEIEDLLLAKAEKAQKKIDELNDTLVKWELLFKSKTPKQLLQFIKDNKIPFPKDKKS